MCILTYDTDMRLHICVGDIVYNISYIILYNYPITVEYNR